MIITPYQITMRWFEGVVENRLDPLKVGRVQVRVFGIHTDNLIDIPTKDLHWMQVAHPTTSPATSGVSDTPYLVEGSHVIGYFRDGDLCQDGIVTGVIAGIPQNKRNQNKGFNDTRTSIQNAPSILENSKPTSNGVELIKSNLSYPRYINEPDLPKPSRNIDNNTTKIKKNNRVENIKIAGGSTYNEPIINNNSVYPYNKVTEYESGHITEFDNTPNNERINITHRVGSYLEFLKNGDVVSKSMNNSYNISHNNSYDYTKNTKNVTVGNGYNMLVNGKLLIEVGSSGDMIISVSGNTSITCSGDFDINVGGNFTVNAESINLN